MTALEWAIESPEGLQWPCTNRETAEAAQHTNPQMTILCRTPGGVWQAAEDSPAPVSELARLRSERAETNAALSKAVEEIAELKAQRERRRIRLVALQNDALNMRGTLSPAGRPRRVPMELGETLTPVVEWLLARVDELEAAQAPAEMTVYRAEHESFVFGLYTTRQAAYEHCEAYEMRDDSVSPMAWNVDEDGVAELVRFLVPRSPGAESATGYVVTPLTVASEYDEEADE